MPNLGIWEILLVLLVLLLIFGPKRLPQMGRSLGRGMREFKESVTDQGRELKEAVGDVPTDFKDGLTGSSPAEPDAEAAPPPVTTPSPSAPSRGESVPR